MGRTKRKNMNKQKDASVGERKVSVFHIIALISDTINIRLNR